MRLNETAPSAPSWHGGCGWSGAVPRPIHTTMLELVSAVASVAADDAEIVATVTSLVNSGRVVLEGAFAGRRIALH